MKCDWCAKEVKFKKQEVVNGWICAVFECDWCDVEFFYEETDEEKKDGETNV